MLHGARWLLNKDIVRGANSYPLKGIVGENRTRAIPFLFSETRGRTNKDQGYDVDKRRDGIGDYRLRDYNRLRSKRFSSRGDNGYGGEGKAKGTEEGRTVVEGDRKGRVVVIGSKEDTY